MSRKIVRLTLDHLHALGGADAPCRSCVFWELDPVRRARLGAEEDRAAEKEAWLSEVLRSWGSCGRVALVDDEPVGLVVYVPAAFAPGAAGFPTAPVSSDAVLLTTAYVAPAHRGGGLGRMLVQGMARDLLHREGIRVVEAFGSHEGSRAGSSCVLPAGFLGSVGFKTHRPHPRTSRMRMELRSALTWRDDLEAAFDRLRGVVSQPAVSRPVTERRGRGCRASATT